MTGAVIHVIGNLNVDLIMGPLGAWPRVGTEIILPKSETRIGGGAGNAGLALQALGARHRLITSVGDDIFGTWLKAGFTSGTGDWVTAPCATTLSVGIVDPGGERTFLTSQGHLAVFDLADALAQLPARAQPGDLLLMEGCFLSEPLLERYEELLATAVARGFALALDTGWPPQGWSPDLRRRVISWLRSCDHLLINEVEALGLSGAATLEAAIPVLHQAIKPGATLVVKRGPAGATGLRGEAHLTAGAPKVAVFDTIGAGDIFNAGYLTALVAGADLAAALAAGVATASLAVSTSPRRYR